MEIRDYLITKRLAEACKTKPVTVLYFYSNAGDCGDCDKAGYALSYLRNTYPTLRVYSFDYNLELGALKTFIAVTKVKDTLPAFVINGKHSYGFSSLADLEKQLQKCCSTPELCRHFLTLYNLSLTSVFRESRDVSLSDYP